MREKMKVLLVDGDKNFAKILENKINMQNDIEFVGCVSDGNDAIDVILTKKPDVVLLEIVLANLDGLEILEKISNVNIPKNIIYIVVTSICENKVIQKASVLRC